MNDVIPRSRSRDTIKAVPLTGEFLAFTNYLDCNISPSWHASALSNLTDTVGRREVMHDFVTSGFYRRRARGDVVFNDMYHEILEIFPAVGQDGGVRDTFEQCAGTSNPFKNAWKTSGVGRSIFSSFLNTSTTHIGGSISNAQISRAIAEATTECLAARARVDSNLYESLAQMNKTLGVFHGILQNGLGLISSKRKLLQRAKDSANGYLAYRYGLKPLMTDIETVIRALNESVGRVRITSRGFSSAVETGPPSTVEKGIAGMQYVTFTSVVNETATIRAMSLDEIRASFLSNSGFHTKGLVTLPWELLPYSFVVDWFVNVSDFINSLVPVYGLTQLGSCLVTERSRDLTIVAHNARPVSSSYTMISPFGGSKSATYKTRSRVRLGSPELTLRPSFGFENLTRCADAASLLVGRLR